MSADKLADKLAEIRDELIVAADKATQGVCMIPLTTVRYLAVLLLHQEMVDLTNAIEEEASS